MTLKFKAFIPIVALALCGCSNSDPGQPEAFGFLAPSATADNSTIELASTISSRSADSPMSPFALSVFDTNSSLIGQWDDINSYPTTEPLKIGTYILEAKSGDPADEGFNKPAYAGRATVNVAEAAVARAPITCRLVNSLVKAEASDAFNGFFANYTVTLTTPTGAELPLEVGSDRPLYCMPGVAKLSLALTKQNGSTLNVASDGFSLEPRTLHTIRLMVNSDDMGQAAIKVTIDSQTAIEEVDVDLTYLINNL